MEYICIFYCIYIDGRYVHSQNSVFGIISFSGDYRVSNQLRTTEEFYNGRLGKEDLV